MIKNIFHSLIFLVTFTNEAQNSIEYSLTENEDYHDEIKAVINGKEYILIPYDEELCLRIVRSDDFNNDEYQDVLVKHITACGGVVAQTVFKCSLLMVISFIKVRS